MRRLTPERDAQVLRRLLNPQHTTSLYLSVTELNRKEYPMSEAVYEVGASVRPKQDVIARTVGDETILLDLQSGTYFTLNRVGSVIWQALAGRFVDRRADD